MTSPNALFRLVFAAILFGCICSPAVHAYSVLSHEEVVDMAWTQQIVPLLHERFPDITDDQIKEAHAYAYGGSIIQDIGYYPFGDKEFSDLLHYARPNAFIAALFHEAQDPNDFAFACGALAHYFGDTLGHPFINEITAQEYPKLRRRFGKSVTYSNDPTAHLRVEFGFDVVEVAHGRYEQQNYRDFIGFQVAKPLLERAFLDTYGIPMNHVMKHEDLAISTYRFAVSNLIPKMTHVALAHYRDQITKENPSFDEHKFLYRFRRTEFEKDYGKQYAKPGFGAQFLAFVIRFVPKVGPFRALSLHIPTPQEQDLYLKSVNTTEDGFRQSLAAMRTHTKAPPPLPEVDFDTGKPIESGEYPLADKTYAKLLERLTSDNDAQLSPLLRSDVLAFYDSHTGKNAVEQDPVEWAKVQSALAKLKQTQPAPAATPGNL